MSYYSKADPVFKNVTTLSWFNFFSDFKLYSPFVILYFQQVTGSFTLGMSIFSIVMISSAIFEVPTGIFSDRIGRKKTVILGSIAAVIFTLLYAIGGNYWILAMGAVCEGMSRSLYSGNNSALLHDSLTQSGKEHMFSEYFGKTSAMFQLALGSGAILGGILATFSFYYVMWLSVIPQVFCLFLSFLIIEPRVKTNISSNIYTHMKESLLHFKKNPRLRLLTFSSMITNGVSEAAYQFQAAFYNLIWPIWAIGLIKTYSNVAATLSFYFGDIVIKRLSPLKSLFWGSLISRVLAFIALLYPTIISPAIYSSTSWLFGITSVARGTLIQKEFTTHQRATMGSLNSLAGSIAFGIISVLIGYVADTIGPINALILLTVIASLQIPIYLRLFIHEKKP